MPGKGVDEGPIQDLHGTSATALARVTAVPSLQPPRTRSHGYNETRVVTTFCQGLKSWSIFDFRAALDSSRQSLPVHTL